MKKLIPFIIGAALILPTTAFATPISWDFASGVLQPLQSAWGALVKADHYQATSTTAASIFPYASTTALSVSSLTSGNCVQAGTGGLLTTTLVPCGTGSGSGGPGTIATSSPDAITQIPFYTTTNGYPALVSATSSFVYATSTNRLTVGQGNASQAGIIMGNIQSGFSGLWSTQTAGASPTTGNFLVLTNGPTVDYNAPTTLNLMTGGGTRATLFGNNFGVATGTPWALLSVGSTAGVPQFAIGSSTGTQFIVDQNGRVGVGTGAPNTLLTIEGTNNQINVRNAGSTFGMLLGVGGNYTGIANSASIINVNATPLAFGTSNTIKMLIDSNGNVGIGTSTPGSLLAVQGGTSVLEGTSGVDNEHVLTINRSDLPKRSIWFAPSAGGDAVQIGGTGFAASPTLAFTGFASINVGSTPFVGTTEFANSVAGFFDPAPGVNVPVKLSNTGSGGTPIGGFSAGVAGTLSANTNTYSGFYSNSSVVSGTGIAYGLYSTGSGSNYFNGKTGLGTTTPDQTLNVNGNTVLENQGQLRFNELRTNGPMSASLSATSSMAANVNWTLPGTDGSLGNVLTTNGVGNLYWSAPSGGSSFGYPFSTLTNFGTTTAATTTPLWVQNGIFASTTSSTLPALAVSGATTLNGTLAVTGDAAVANVIFPGSGRISRQSGFGGLLFDSANNITQQAGNFVLSNSGSSLGVGTSTPVRALDVVGASGIPAARFSTLSTAASIEINGNPASGASMSFGNSDTWTSNALIGSSGSTNKDLRFAVGGNNIGNFSMILTSAGNLGLGTSSPARTLSIVGNSYFAGPILATSTLTLSALATPAGSFLAVDPNGTVIATTTPSGGSGTNYLTISGNYTYLNTGTNLTAPVLTATSTTATSTINILQVGTGSASSSAAFVIDGQGAFPKDSINVYSNGIETQPFFAIANNSKGYFNGGSVAPSGGLGAMLTIAHDFTAQFDPLKATGSQNNYPLMVQNLSSLNASSTGIGFAVTNVGSGGSVGGAMVFKRTGSNSMGELQFLNHEDATAGSALIQALTISDSGKVGIGTTSPFSVLSITGNGTKPLFAVATTSGQGLPNFAIDASGHIVTSGGTPTLSSCGTGTPTAEGNDTNFRITTETSASNCTATFVSSYVKAPICLASEESGVSATVVGASSTPTTVVLSFAAGLTGKEIAVHCEGYQ